MTGKERKKSNGRKDREESEEQSGREESEQNTKRTKSNAEGKDNHQRAEGGRNRARREPSREKEELKRTKRRGEGLKGGGEDKKVVLLVHGMMASSADYVENDPDQALGKCAPSPLTKQSSYNSNTPCQPCSASHMDL